MGMHSPLRHLDLSKSRRETCTQHLPYEFQSLEMQHVVLHKTHENSLKQTLQAAGASKCSLYWWCIYIARCSRDCSQLDTWHEPEQCLFWIDMYKCLTHKLRLNRKGDNAKKREQLQTFHKQGVLFTEFLCCGSAYAILEGFSCVVRGNWVLTYKRQMSPLRITSFVSLEVLTQRYIILDEDRERLDVQPIYHIQ